ncbi:AraC family transcriptional regulator [Paenibacillus odorifer]|uniref:AraC family transcriptional regulator n=1 Tax=Paenibacillus TaxID=44249 RepID=UPI00096F368D|nr:MULTISPECIES: AraC family transcriptional regulator [Paenibacillus]MDH6430519.1 AraC-like DNA-binding protein [Paenibacillus sp. PastH-4]MDH6443735.1 AraC-like DNA-binding protein [Paenibacillus sp. PastF-4]MDH6527643.1 AraC-like DNA-binding protein [Paenibacillus sp. PastH-3]OMD62305.1 AraC family transcriptional regulator [Paenibacillus odorifer]
MASEHYHFTAGFNLAPDDHDLSVLFSGEGKPVPGHKMGPSVHDYYLIHTVIDGEGVFQSGSNSQGCSKGDTFVIFQGALFSYQADMDRPWTYVWVALQGEAVEQLLHEVGITRDKPIIHLDNLIEIHKIYEHIRLSFQQSAYPRLESLEASGWLRLLVHKFGVANISSLPSQSIELPDVIDRQIDQAIRWISLQFHQQISIDHMASSLGYHRAHLSKVFKQKIGMSPKQYLLKVRMDNAKKLLGGTLTIDQISSSVGFNDALYFSKQFRKWSGMSPSEFRNHLRTGK